MSLTHVTAAISMPSLRLADPAAATAAHGHAARLLPGNDKKTG
jgi:hypothetical protein